MAKVITEKNLRVAVRESTFIKNGREFCVEGIKYDFCMGTRVLKPGYGSPISIPDLPEKEKAALTINPGEVVFVLTEERLALPNNIHATLSPKRKLSHDGIMVLGGFCIDPLYSGYLLLGMYNFSSSPFPLKPGKKIIAAVFYELSEDELDAFKAPTNPIDDFPDPLIQMMEKYSPVSLQKVMGEFSEIKNRLQQIETKFNDHDLWYKDFQASLETQGMQIQKLSELLEAEATNRKDEDKELKADLKDIAKTAYKTGAIAAALGALIVALVILVIQKILGK